MNVKERISTEQIAKYVGLVEPKKKLRKKGGRALLMLGLVCVVIGGLIGGFGPILLDKGVIRLEIVPPFPVKAGFEFLYLILFLVYYYVTAVLHTVLHEGGHMVFGRLTGYRFLSFRVFSFTIVKKDGRLVKKRIKIPGTMGQCLMTPPEWKEDVPYPYIWYNLGGGLMNLIFCLLAVPLFFIHSPLWGWLAGIFIFTGIIFALSNILPMTIGIPNDGKNCLLCKKEKENQKAFYLQLKLNAMLSEGAKFTDIPEEMFSVGGEGRLNALTCPVRLFAFYKYMGNQEEKEAEACLATMEACLESLPMGFANSIDMERLYLLLLNEGASEEIAAYYGVIQPVFAQGKDISILRVKYAYYLLLSEEERERIEWLVCSRKGKLPKKLPKRKKVTADQIYEEMEKAYKKHPVIGEAELHMSLARVCKELVKQRMEADDNKKCVSEAAENAAE